MYRYFMTSFSQKNKDRRNDTLSVIGAKAVVFRIDEFVLICMILIPHILLPGNCDVAILD